MTSNHGGYRRLHVQPALSPDQVREIKQLRDFFAVPYKLLQRWYRLERATLARAAHSKGPYEGYLP